MNKELINSAIAKITEEALSIKDAFSQMIEEYLTDICKTDAVATKLLAENKSLIVRMIMKYALVVAKTVSRGHTREI